MEVVSVGSGVRLIGEADLDVCLDKLGSELPRDLGVLADALVRTGGGPALASSAVVSSSRESSLLAEDGVSIGDVSSDDSSSELVMNDSLRCLENEEGAERFRGDLALLACVLL